MPHISPLIVTLEPVTRHRLRAVLMVEGAMVDMHDIALEEGTPASLGGDLSALIDAANLQGRPVEISAPWSEPVLGLLTLRQKLRHVLSEYQGPLPRRAA
ncbi:MULTISPECIES: hypothetical protein [unclassified Sulfitobacter]|uniref:hypothetical protein n=1 Tax=unclassified Sulfitobacter TaxID=196795 RepID=UPI0023E12140|nr:MULTISPECIES: hypothetical protein [unclassified Sulfitobacter]MDF3383345.1 hypothetical protein [Sulfitobacter sp. Ks11]MDF3386764.1 hypothetical protein [Sulfitobacter sp. M85]MDF3390183.1 hypothetical protein [Sulfitobacter sp. Ks16]MDF3400820.1 hypothetical protein [Sulfitobacter sp. KE39]MDF3404241.1 hypothetical protein [Sulfitobacter sp. Ks35]